MHLKEVFESLTSYHHDYSDDFRKLPDGLLLPVLNSGFYGGNLKGMIKLLKIMTTIFECSSHKSVKMTTGMDQAVLNFVAYFIVPYHHHHSQSHQSMENDEKRRRLRKNASTNNNTSFDFYLLNSKVVSNVVHYVREPKFDGSFSSKDKIFV